jgi:putative thiamine transport system permease protein
MLGLLLTASAVGALALRGASIMWRFPSVLPAEFNGGLFMQLAPTLVAPTRTTVLLAALTGLLSVALALIAAEVVAADSRRRQRWGAVLFLPLLLPQLAFLFGLQWLLLRLTLDGSFLAVLWAHVTLALPYVFGILASARAALDPRLMLSARVLGASPVRVWWTVTAPPLARAMLLAFSIAFAVSTALYLPTLFAGGGRIVTVATEAASAVSGGQLGIAAVYGALQAVAPCLALLLAALISHRLYRDRRGVPT